MRNYVKKQFSGAKNTKVISNLNPHKVHNMSTCAECEHAELQCPPVIRCKVIGDYRYLDSKKCKDFTD